MRSGDGQRVIQMKKKVQIKLGKDNRGRRFGKYKNKWEFYSVQVNVTDIFKKLYS